MKNIKIGDKLTRVPLIQGGMGVGISPGKACRGCGQRRRHRHYFQRTDRLS